MARARNIKPGFFFNTGLSDIEPLGRLLFIGLWTIADRDGRLNDDVRWIKAQTLPYDNCDVNGLLNELDKKNFIIRYEIKGNKYVQIVNFDKHQNPHKAEKNSEIPAHRVQKSTIQEQCKNSAKTEEAPNKYATKTEEAGLIPDSLLLIPDSLNQVDEEFKKLKIWIDSKNGSRPLSSKDPKGEREKIDRFIQLIGVSKMIDIAEEEFAKYEFNTGKQPNYLCFFFSAWEKSATHSKLERIEELKLEIAVRDTQLRTNYKLEEELKQQYKEDIELIKAEICELKK